jgi:hypothetical protein
VSFIHEVGASIEDAWLWFNTARVVAAAALGALGIAAVTATVAVRTLRQTRRDSKAKARPKIAAELRLVPYTKGSLSLVVRNTGPSIAKNVRVTFDPPILMPKDPEGLVTPFLLRRFAKPIPVMTPGMELDNLYYVAVPDPAGSRKLINSEPIPDVVTVKISYSSDDGDPYTDEFPLDADLHRKRTYITSSTSPDAQAKELLRILQNIDRSLESVAESGAMVTKEERAEQIREQIEQMKALDAALVERTDGTPPTE